MSPIELVSGLEWISQILLDYEDYVHTFPLLSLMDYISTDIIKSTPFMMKARVLKSISLAKLGYIGESIDIFFKLLLNKDKVLNCKYFNINLSAVGSQTSYFRLKEGCDFKFTDSRFIFHNHLPPEHFKNQKSLDQLITSKITLSHNKISPYLKSTMLYLRAIILQTIVSKIRFHRAQSTLDKTFA